MNELKNNKDVAVLLMLFNRPETTRQVFNQLKQAKPSKLFIAANGPRLDHPKDIVLCQEVRDIFNEIDWPCDVHTNYPNVNENMHARWWQTCDWFFESVDSGIILEDDCVPSVSFFDYCIELLDRYKDDEMVMHINGSNFQFGNKRGNASYYFSKYSHVWGWATWKRAWKKYDYSMSTFLEFKEKRMIETTFKDEKQKSFWMTFLEKIHTGIFPTADVRWNYAVWFNKGFCIAPNVNMISNIGFGPSAEHTFLKHKTLDQPALDIGKLIHPDSSEIVPDYLADEYTYKVCYERTFFQKALYVGIMKIRKLLKP